LNAVHDYLRGLGVRWFMPGELGEVVPKMASIPLPRASGSRSRETSDDARNPNSDEPGYVHDKTVRPDFAVHHHLKLNWSLNAQDRCCHK
jgi:hypothetical protein